MAPLRPGVPAVGTRRRIGCLGGCLGTLLSGILILLIIGVPVTLGVVGLLAPWNFYFGGHFHLLAGWQGWGRLHDPQSGADYDLWIRLQPTVPRLRASPMRGLAYLCTPRGERIRLSVGGSFLERHGVDLTGVPLHFYLHRYVAFWGLNGDPRPHLDLYGAFGDSVLNLEDRGSLMRAFAPDGALRQPGQPVRRAENLQLTIHESTPWVISPACPRAGD